MAAIKLAKGLKRNHEAKGTLFNLGKKLSNLELRAIIT